jgi:hypothetical protein
MKKKEGAVISREDVFFRIVKDLKTSDTSRVYYIYMFRSIGHLQANKISSLKCCIHCIKNVSKDRNIYS